MWHCNLRKKGLYFKNRFVKAEENLQAKSLQAFMKKYGLPRAVRTSTAGYREQDWLVNVPLYAIGSGLGVGQRS